MRAGRMVSSAILAGLLALPLSAQTDNTSHPPQQQSHPNQNSKKGQKQGPKLGDWLREHKDLPPDQQEKLLERDPNFQRLPAQRQAELKERLRKFNNLTPEQKQRTLDRMEFMSNLSQDQRKELREANQQLQSLPADRKVMVHKALRSLRQMSPQQRQQVMQSSEFKSRFSDQEQVIVKRLADIVPPPAASTNSH